MIRFATARPAVRSVLALVLYVLVVSAPPVLAQSDGMPPPASLLGNVMRDPKTGKLVLQPPVLEIHVCVNKADDPACEVTVLQSALDGISPGGTVFLHPGKYRQGAFVRFDRTRIEALPGAELVGTPVGGKAALVITANDVVIDGLACSGISVRDRNGACIRQEGKNLTLRNVHFHDSEQGLLYGRNGGLLLIEDSRLDNLGRGGSAPGVSVGSGELIVRRSVFIASKGQGHEIKSRAKRTVIEDSIVASLGAKDSYLIDVPNGGYAIIRRNILQEGPASANGGAIAFGMEGDRQKDSRIRIENNVILMDRRNAVLVRSKGHKASLSGNVIVGPHGKYRLGGAAPGCGEAGNTCVNDRAALKALADLPLPRIPGLGRLLTETGLWRH